MAGKQRSRWSHRNDELLIREMFTYEPWQYTKGTEGGPKTLFKVQEGK